MPLYKTQIPEVTHSIEEKNPQTQDLLGKIGNEIGNTVKAFNELPKKEKIGLVGGATALIGYLTLFKDNKLPNKPKGASEKLTNLKKSVISSFNEIDGSENIEPDKAIKTGKEKIIQKEEITLNDLAITKKIESLSPTDRVIYGIKLAMEKYKTGARHCGDWVKKIYKAVGCNKKTIYQNLNYEGRDCGNIHAKNEDVSKIKPGYHIYYNNKNKSSKHGNHSAIFIEWINYDKKIARVASYNAKSNKSSIHNADFKKDPVTFIGQPEIQSPVELASLQYYLRGEPAKIKGSISTKRT